MKQIVYILTPLFLVFSCASKHKDELNDVEVLQAELATLENTFYSISIEDVKEAKKAYVENMRSVKTYYFPDSLDNSFTSMLNSYKGIKHSTKTIDYDFISNQDNINAMKTQLENLHKDIKNDVLPEDSIRIFIEQESQNLESLSENVGSYIVNADYTIELHDSLSQKISDYIKPFITSF